MLPHIGHIILSRKCETYNESELGCVVEEAGFDTIEEQQMVVENDWEASGGSLELQVQHGKGECGDNQELNIRNTLK